VPQAYTVRIQRGQAVCTTRLRSKHLRGGVAKGIYLPANRRHIVKLLLEEAMAEGRVFDHAHIVRARLVVHRPAAIDKLQLPALDEAAHNLGKPTATVHSASGRSARLGRPPRSL